MMLLEFSLLHLALSPFLFFFLFFSKIPYFIMQVTYFVELSNNNHMIKSQIWKLSHTLTKQPFPVQ